MFKNRIEKCLITLRVSYIQTIDKRQENYGVTFFKRTPTIERRREHYGVTFSTKKPPTIEKR